MARSRGRFRIRISAHAISPPVYGIAALDKPTIDAAPVGTKAHSHEAVVSVTLYKLAASGTGRSKEPIKRKC